MSRVAVKLDVCSCLLGVSHLSSRGHTVQSQVSLVLETFCGEQEDWGECALYRNGPNTGDIFMLLPFPFFWFCSRMCGSLPSFYDLCANHAAGMAAGVICGLPCIQPDLYNRFRKPLLIAM
jgi:hypothetical protein